MNEEELSYIIAKEIITEEYETLIFDYLASNSVDLKDEDIKKIVDLKCKQFVDVLKENKKLKQQIQQRDNIINKAREFINEYEKNRNCFKWNEQDYIDTINEIKEILNIDKGE